MLTRGTITRTLGCEASFDRPNKTHRFGEASMPPEYSGGGSTSAPEHPYVTATSSEAEILAAINAAGEHRLRWRKHDWPPESEGDGAKSWVKPSDIGYSVRGDTKLLKRLRQMVKAGLIEQRYVAFSSCTVRGWRCEKLVRKGMFPRFRVIRRNAL